MHAPDDDINMASGGAKIPHLLYFFEKKKKRQKEKGQKNRRKKEKEKEKEEGKRTKSGSLTFSGKSRGRTSTG